MGVSQEAEGIKRWLGDWCSLLGLSSNHEAGVPSLVSRDCRAERRRLIRLQPPLPLLATSVHLKATATPGARRPSPYFVWLCSAPQDLDNLKLYEQAGRPTLTTTDLPRPRAASHRSAARMSTSVRARRHGYQALYAAQTLVQATRLQYK